MNVIPKNSENFDYTSYIKNSTKNYICHNSSNFQYSNKFSNYMNELLLKMRDSDSIIAKSLKSFNVWFLSHYLAFIRFVNIAKYDDWLGIFLHLTSEGKHFRKLTTDKSADFILSCEDKDLINESTQEKITNPPNTNNGGGSSPPTIIDNDNIKTSPPEEKLNDYPIGKSYYVAKNGNDLNSGTESSPWRTIQKAADVMVTGDVVYIKEGVYNERIWPENSGSSGKFITYTSYSDDNVVIDGSNIPIDWGGLIHIYGKNHIIISGLSFRDSSCFGVYVTGQKSNNIVIKNCNFENMASSAIQILGRYWLRQIHDITIQNNFAKNICYNSKQEAISLSGVYEFDIYDNTITNCPKYSINVKDGCANGRIYKNRVNASKGNGIYCDAFDLDNFNIDIYENIIWGEKTGIVLGTEHGGTLRNIKVYDNIIFTTGNGFQINNHTSYRGSHKKTDLVVRNNIFYDNSICILITDARENFYGLTISNNIFNDYGTHIYFVTLRESDVNINNNFFNEEININFNLLKV